ncbi:MAG TPA: phosphatase PAP2 family protein [Vicinamibacterales bacterium]|nr:phosphatase PAP2 family protein [Vicinamibacterales bacterium]
MFRRVYFFEVFALANLGVLYLIARHTLPIVGIPWRWIVIFALGMVPQALAGIAARSLVALIRRDFTYFHIIRSGAWIADTLRLMLFTGVMVFTYGWLKLVVPLLHPRLFDQELWDLDQLLFFGIAPSQFFADVFHHGVLRAVDWSYANIFYASAFVAFAYFLSEPSRRVRVAFANGNAAMWIIGAWLYLLLPSLGPAYRFPDIWFAHEEALKRTQALQAVLMRNYQNVLRVVSGQSPTDVIRIYFGIGAFPSLHVAFQMYVFLWMRRLWTSGEVLFAIFVLAIFLGSMITGWHYLIDGIAGILLAWGCYAATWRASRMSRWLAIKTAR